MNFLFVLYIGFDQHGPSVHLLKEMIRQCLESGHHVRIIVTNHGGSDPDIPVELQHYKNLHCDVIYDKSLKKSALVKRYFQDFRYAFLCKKIYKRYKDTDAVFLQSNPSPLIALKMLNYVISQTMQFLYSTFLRKKRKERDRVLTKTDIFQLTGACMILTPKFFECCGYLDDSVFMWGEEVLLAHQVEVAKGVITYDPSLYVLHMESASVNKISSRKSFKMTKAS